MVPDGASSQPDGSAGPVASTGAEASVAPGALGIGSGPFFLSDPRSGLDALPAYEETLTIAFSGTVDGAPRQWSTTHRFQHTATPAMSMLTIEAGVGVGAPVEDPVLVAEGSGAMYEQAAAGPCMGRRLDPTRSRLAELEPAAQIPGLMGADEAGSESLSGVATKHYRFDGRAILEGAGPQTTGDVWVAAADGSVRKYVRSTTADAGYFGGGMAGTMTWTYGLRELDAATRVALPRACQLDVPVMSGATDLLVLPTYAGFDTSSTVAQVAAFYKAQLPPAGWAYASTPVTSSTQVVLTFKSGARVLNVIVTAAAAGRRVDLALVGG
ncbi:MAG TPA: hypothetical protein VGI98_06100 [Candidatus Limnocylindrales bacterium]